MTTLNPRARIPAILQDSAQAADLEWLLSCGDFASKEELLKHVTQHPFYQAAETALRTGQMRSVKFYGERFSSVEAWHNSIVEKVEFHWPEARELPGSLSLEEMSDFNEDILQAKFDEQASCEALKGCLYEF